MRFISHINKGNAVRYAVLLLLSPIIFTCLFFFVYATTSSYGYCWPKDRFMSDDEKIRAVIARINDKPSFAMDIGSTTVGYPRIPYDSVDDFMLRNPGCCVLRPDNNFERLLNMLGGVASSRVSVTYTNYYRDDTGAIQSKRVEVGGQVTSCGYLIAGFD